MVNKKIQLVSMKRRLSGINQDFTLKNGLEYSINTTFLSKTNECKEVIAIDTETFEGNCKLICISGYNLDNFELNIKPNNIFEPSFDDCIRIMTYHINNSGVYRFFWNIDFDIQAILKLYDKPDKIDFLNNISKGIPVLYIDHRGINYEFRWIRGKFFGIKQLSKKKNVIFTDLYSFYNLGLGLASQKYLKYGKIKGVDAEKLNTDITYWKHKYDIIRYCIRDSELTAKLGKYLIDSIIAVDLQLPKLLVSPASISKANYRYMNDIPNLSHTSIEIVQIAFDCYFGGRFEIFKRGFFELAYLYDIVSEYPSFIRNLPDMFSGSWIKQKEGKITLPIKPPLLAFYKVKLDIPFNAKISTIPYKAKSGIVCFPIGKFENWFTWFDLDLVREYIVEIFECYEYKQPCEYISQKPNRNLKYPFREMTDKLFQKKKSIDKIQKPMNYNIVKITMNGIYGCTIEKHENIFVDDNGNEYKKLKGGVLFNPIYASHITSFGRWKLFKNIPKEKWNNIIGVHTDSLMTDIDISEHLNIGNNLGNWNLEAKGKAIVLATGMYQIGKLVKTRGIPKKFIKNWLYFCLKNSNKNEKKFIIKHMRKIREAIIQDKSVINMNTMVDIERSVNANSDTKRTWFGNFDNFSGLITRTIDSLPLLYKDNELNPNPIVLAKKLGIDIDIANMIIDNKKDLF